MSGFISIGRSITQILCFTVPIFFGVYPYHIEKYCLHPTCDRELSQNLTRLSRTKDFWSIRFAVSFARERKVQSHKRGAKRMWTHQLAVHLEIGSSPASKFAQFCTCFQIRRPAPFRTYKYIFWKRHRLAIFAHFSLRDISLWQCIYCWLESRRFVF